MGVRGEAGAGAGHRHVQAWRVRGAGLPVTNGAECSRTPGNKFKQENSRKFSPTDLSLVRAEL